MDEFKNWFWKCSSSKNDAAGVTRIAAPLGVCRQIQMWLLNNIMNFVASISSKQPINRVITAYIQQGASRPHKYSKMIQLDVHTSGSWCGPCY